MAVKWVRVTGNNVTQDKTHSGYQWGKPFSAPHLEVGDGVERGQPGGARVLLESEGTVEGLCDCAEVEGTNR